MSTILAMCCHDSVENGRTDYTRRTLESLLQTVDFNKHRLGIFDNASCQETKDLLIQFKNRWDNNNLFPKENLILLSSQENIGTARGINEIWKLRKEGENVGKMDNDVVIHQAGWVDQIEECFSRYPLAGVICLKRKDIWENVLHEHEWYRSRLQQLSHEAGQRWFILEIVKHCIGTCQIYSKEFFAKAGYLWQQSQYSMDDSYMAHRIIALGYESAFLPHIEIDHIDPGGDAYTQWKRDEAGEAFKDYNRIVDGIYSGKINPYFDGVNYDIWDKY